jgi:hypothetical protein
MDLEALIESKAEELARGVKEDCKHRLTDMVQEIVGVYQQNKSPSFGKKRSVKTRPRSRRTEGKVDVADEKARETRTERDAYTVSIRPRGKVSLRTN